MSDSENTDRLLSEKELIRITEERCGLSAVKFIEIIHDCPAASALSISYPGEKEKENK